MDKEKILVAPSILSADFSKLGEEIWAVENAGADWIHIDVMDGAFVPNITIGSLVVKSIRKESKAFFDVHLMIQDPLKHIDPFIAAGSDLITFHAEACDNAEEIIKRIKTGGKKAGVSIKPDTKVSAIEKLYDKVDLILIMTVEPGFGGQFFMPKMMDKVKEVAKKFNGYIEVDGGINSATARVAVDAGVNVLVAGTAVFGEKDYSKAIKAIRGI